MLFGWFSFPYRFFWFKAAISGFTCGSAGQPRSSPRRWFRWALLRRWVDQARQAGHPDYAPQFLALEFEEMFAFSAFIIAGLLSRRNPAEHKRWMILSAVAISDAGFGRIWQIGIKHTLPGLFGWWLQYFWGVTLLLIAMLTWDWFSTSASCARLPRGRPLLWGGQVATTILNFTPDGSRRWSSWSGCGDMPAEQTRLQREGQS